MLTQQELQALVQLLSRVPVSQAELLWLNELIAKLNAAIQQEADAQ